MQSFRKSSAEKVYVKVKPRKFIKKLSRETLSKSLAKSKNINSSQKISINSYNEKYNNACM